MKILYLSKYAINPNYGSPTRQFFYCKYLSRIDENEVLLMSSRSVLVHAFPAFRGRVKHESFDRLTNAILNGPAVGMGFTLRRIWSWIWFEIQLFRSYFHIRKWKPDVIIVSSLSLLTFFTGIIFKRLLKVPLIIEVRDIYPLTLVEVGGFRSWNPAVLVLGWIEKAGYRHADAIVSSLPNLGPHVENRIGKSKQVTWLPMGYDPEFFEESEPTEKAIDSLRKIDQFRGTFSVGYCGSIGLANALNEPLKAFYSMGKDVPDVHLWIVGDGPKRVEYEREFGSTPNIHFLGRHDKKDLPHLIDKFDLVINPWLDKSIYRFGVSPNKWIDYMYGGKPILVPYGGFRFLIDAEKIGWFVAPENESEFRKAILQLRDTPKTELVARGKNGRQFLETHLKYENLAGKLYDVAKEITGLDSHQKGIQEDQRDRQVDSKSEVGRSR